MYKFTEIETGLEKCLPDRFFAGFNMFIVI